MLAVDLRSLDRSILVDNADRRLVSTITGAPLVSVGVVGADTDVTFAPLVDAFDVLIGEATGANTVVDVDDALAELERLGDRIEASPDASVALVRLLRATHDAPVGIALHAESVTYAMLQSSDRFVEWLGQRTQAPVTADTGPAVQTRRLGSMLEITLTRPERRNALNTAMRDDLTEAFTLLDADQSLDGAVLRGDGPNFCAGGDLTEFGTTPSPATGHRVRSLRSLPAMIHRLRERVRVEVHGACVGAGIELPAFAHAVIANPDSTFTLPEVGFGLVPGAGGTVSVTRRCGRHRTAWLALTGDTIDARTALRWGLVDRIAG